MSELTIEPIQAKQVSLEKPSGASPTINKILALSFENIKDNISKTRKELDSDTKGLGVQAVDLSLMLVTVAIQDEIIRLIK